MHNHPLLEENYKCQKIKSIGNSCIPAFCMNGGMVDDWSSLSRFQHAGQMPIPATLLAYKHAPVASISLLKMYCLEHPLTEQQKDNLLCLNDAAEVSVGVLSMLITVFTPLIYIHPFLKQTENSSRSKRIGTNCIPASCMMSDHHHVSFKADFYSSGLRILGVVCQAFAVLSNASIYHFLVY